MKQFPWWFVVECKFFYWFFGKSICLMQTVKTKAEKLNRPEIVARCNTDLEIIERERNRIGAALFINDIKGVTKQISPKDCRITSDNM